MTLVCEVEYRPPNNSYNIDINWYRSRNEESAGIGGEILNDENKYLQHVRDLTLMNQTFIRQYMLGVLRFNNSDRGYYWCQMVVNNVSLSPSPYGHLSSSQCVYLHAICTPDQPICAQNTSVRYMAFENGHASCSLAKFNNISSTTSEIVTATVTVLKFPTTEIETVTMSIFPTTEVISAIVSGLVVFILLSLMVMVLCFLFIRRKRRYQGMYTIICYSITFHY